MSKFDEKARELLKNATRNPIIISPSPRAAKCCSEAARICYVTALRADDIM